MKVKSKLSDSTSARNHLTRILDLADVAAEKHWVIFRHDYDLLCFGSFILEIGTRKLRRKYLWDGKEATLEILAAQLSDSKTVAEWKPDKKIKLGFDQNEPYQTIESDLKND